MKMSLRILAIFLVGLFAISMIGCDRDSETSDTPEEKLAGKYSLSSAQIEVDGIVDTFEGLNTFGSFILNYGGTYSMSLSIEGRPLIWEGDTWSATASRLTFDGRDSRGFDYELNGSILTLSDEETSLGMTWEKL